MANRSPEKALHVVRRIEMMCDFIENPALREAVQQAVPVTMPPAPGALGFDIPLWVGLGVVGLWAALDGFAERACLSSPKCQTCGRRCIPAKYTPPAQGSEPAILAEQEDLRHLFAHNYAGASDEEYFGSVAAPRGRHVLDRDVTHQLISGGHFDGQRVHLDLPHLRT